MSEHEVTNRKAAERFGWDPSWLGVDSDEYGEALTDAIKAYQRVEGLLDDGIARILTFRRLITDAVLSGKLDIAEPTAAPSDCILVGGELLPVPWDRIVTPGEEGALVLKRGFKARKRKREEVRACVIHWDVTPSPAVTRRVLHAGGISTHFVISWDGIIYQLVDLAHTAWHAGVRRINEASIGIDYNNLVRPRLQKKYKKKLKKMGQPPREVLSGWRVGGWNPGEFLGQHDAQDDALAALLAGLAIHFPNLELSTPTYSKRKRLKRQPINTGTFAGIFHHAEVDVRKRGKWDTLGVELDVILEATRAIGV